MLLELKGKQRTGRHHVHVDDLKLNHKDSNVVSNIIAKIQSIYATTDPMTVHQGKVHHYPGMTTDFRVPGEVQITMYDYIKKLIESLLEEPEHLFRTDMEAIKLSKDIEEDFHKITAPRYYGKAREEGQT